MDRSFFMDLFTKTCRLDPRLPVIVGVSGGPDSLCLLHLLHSCNFRCIAAHLDHSLRPSSNNEAKFVTQICQNLGIDSVVKLADVLAHARQNRTSIEESARVLRYEFLFAVAKEKKAQAVLVGHHADDQVETVLMHLLRGSGANGLAGMRVVLLPNPWSDVIPLIRPLLDTDREEILRLCAEFNLEPVADESNADSEYFRNRIRNELLPELATYNPRIKDRIKHMADVVSAENDYMDQQMEAAWMDVLVRAGPRMVILEREKVASLHQALLRLIIRKAIQGIHRTLRDIDYAVVDRAAAFCVKPNRTNHLDLCAGIEVFNYSRDRLVFAFVDDPLDELWPQLTGMSLGVVLPGEDYQVNEWWKLTSSTVKEFILTDDPYVCFVDGTNFTVPLSIRGVRDGERFPPFGMNGKKVKLGDFWTNEGLPERARKKWPLVCHADEIVWVPGFRVSENFRVSPATRKIIRMEIKRTGPG